MGGHRGSQICEDIAVVYEHFRTDDCDGVATSDFAQLTLHASVWVVGSFEVE